MIAWRVVTRVLLVGLLLLLITACAALSGPVSTPVPSASTNASAGSITLILWDGWSDVDRQTLEQLITAFNQQHPNGRVLAQSEPLATFSSDLSSQVMSGSGPHIALIPSSWLGTLVNANVLLPLDNLISPAEQQAMLPVTIGCAQVHMQDGQQHLYGLPMSFDTLALFYDKRNVLTPPKTTTDLINLAHGLSAPNATPPQWGLGLNLSLDNTIGYMYAFGGRVFDQKGALVLGDAGRRGAEQWLSWLLQLHNDQQMLARFDSSIQIERELQSRSVFMTFGWAHQLPVYRQIWGDQMGVAPLPMLSETNEPPQPYVQSEVFVINGRIGVAEQRAAVEFLRFMTGVQAQSALLNSDIQPARRDIKLDGDKLNLVVARALRTQAEHGQPINNSANSDAIRNSLQFMQQQVLIRGAKPADAVTDADTRLRTALGLPAR